MKVLGYEVTVRKHGPPAYDNRGTFWPVVREPFTGAWQRNVEWTVDTVLAYHAVYACVTLIASDIGKLRPKLVEQDTDGIWSETQSAAFSPVLRKPNHYQNRIQFIEWWINSKLIRGNTYVLKERDQRGVVRGLYLLDPTRVKPLVAPDGSVFYNLGQDDLSGIVGNVQVPASEIIHDRMNCIFHPLVGTSPIFACGIAATVGLKIESSSANFFAKGSNPSGIVTAPTPVTQEEVDRMAAQWQANFGGDNAGKVAVLGNGLKFEQLRMSAVDAQLIEQLRWTAETVATAFHVPAFKIGAGTMPTYSNGEILDTRYYSDCLQSHIEHFELSMDEGLGLTEKIEGKTYGVELDLDGLLRMDTVSQYDALGKGVGGGFLTPNEARNKIDKKPLKGGDTVYLQQQNYSMAALDERDRSDDPFGTAKTEPVQVEPAKEPLQLTSGDEDEEDEEKTLNVWEAHVSDYEARWLAMT